MIAAPHSSSPPYRSESWSCISSVSGMPFCIVSSLNEPVIVPSMLAPLSPQIQRMSVLSSSPSSSMASMTRPTLWSAFSENPAYTSIWRA